MVVGAPMYSDTDNILPELGRIFILYNNAVSAMACVLPDTSVYISQGHSFTRNQTVVGSVIRTFRSSNMET